MLLRDGISFRAPARARARARNLIEPAYRFCSILPKDTENAKALKELGFSMTSAARLWNVRRAWMFPWLNESQKAIESVLTVFTLEISSTSTTGKEEFVSQQAPASVFGSLIALNPPASAAAEAGMKLDLSVTRFAFQGF
jgi:hypothetical protein